MLAPIDHSLIPNMKNIDPNFLDADFDPGHKHSMPYMWGSIGIGYRKSKVDGVPDSWKWLYDSDKYSARISFRELGHSTRSTFRSSRSPFGLPV